MGDIEVEVVNWSTHNPRSSIKHPRWFALSNRILENPEMFDLNDAEFKAWVYVLCQASQKNSSVVQIHFAHADRVCGVKSKILLSAIGKLQKAKCIQLRDHGVNTCVPVMITTRQDKTEQNKTIQNNNAHADAFASFWKEYPTKKDKSKAKKAYERAIKSGLDPSEILTGLAKYLKVCARDGTFIKNPTTFLNQVRDFLEPDYGASEKVAAAPKKQINYDEITNEIGQALFAGWPIPTKLKPLAEAVGIEKLKALGMAGFEPGGQASHLLKAAAESVGAA